MTWGDVIIDAPKNYPEKRNAKAAEVVNILVQLEGITKERAFTLLLRSQFDMALINEITKAWHYPEYWAYVSICREMDMEPKPPAPEGIYDRTHIAEYVTTLPPRGRELPESYSQKLFLLLRRRAS